MGMSLDEYWNGDGWLATYYRKAQRLKDEMRNQELWLQGAYIQEAFAVVIANSFGKKGSKKQKYRDKPIELYPNEKPKRVSEDEAEKSRQKLIKDLNRWQESWNKAHGVNTDGKYNNTQHKHKDECSGSGEVDRQTNGIVEPIGSGIGGKCKDFS